MKFKQYLTEAKINDGEEAIDFIKKNCKPYLNDWKKSGTWRSSPYNALYSGRKSKDSFGSEDIIIKNVRKNRKPKDTSIMKHNYYDLKFEEKFGLKLRSETVFCVSDTRFAKVYGKPYYIFPIGKYEIYWSPYISDMTMDMTFFYIPGYVDFDAPLKEIEHEIMTVSDNSYVRLLKDINKDFSRYKKGDLAGAIKSKNEVMLHTKKVILVQVDDYYTELINNMIEEY